MVKYGERWVHLIFKHHTQSITEHTQAHTAIAHGVLMESGTKPPLPSDTQKLFYCFVFQAAQFEFLEMAKFQFTFHTLTLAQLAWISGEVDVGPVQAAGDAEALLQRTWVTEPIVWHRCSGRKEGRVEELESGKAGE